MPRKLRYEWGLHIVGPERQVFGSFDHDKIVERKLIGFSGEGSVVNQLGALYYWAWGSCKQGPASIPQHPHRGFEIFTYVLAGRLQHIDSLGNTVTLEAGQWQLMQTGRGVEHEEHFLEVPLSMFQIWFDPGFRQEIEREPSYHTGNGARQDRSTNRNISLVEQSRSDQIQWRTANLSMRDICLSGNLEWRVSQERCLAGAVLDGIVELASSDKQETVREGSFWYFNAESDSNLGISSKSGARIFTIELDLFPPYSLFPKPK